MKLSVAVITALSALSISLTASAAVPKTQWDKYVADIKDIPGLVRFYSFTTADATQPDRSGGSSEMKLSGTKDSFPVVTEGRIDGLAAVVLDENSFRAPQLDELKKEFTVSIWIKPEGAGSKQNGGRVNGMISSSGSGYYDGWRLAVYDMSRMAPSFEIGRGKNAISVRSKISLCRMFWNHLAASWDGQIMKVYVNGFLAGTQEFAGPHQPAKSGLAVGYSGYGVGSLKMAIDEMAIFNRALSPSEIAALSLTRTGLPDVVAQSVNASHSLLLKGETDAARDELKKITAANVSADIKLWAQTAAILIDSKKSRYAEDITLCCSLYETPQLPSHLKGVLLSKIFNACKSSTADIPSSILEKLPTVMNLSDEDKFTCAVALARACVAEKQEEKAVKVFEHLISLSKNEPEKQADLGFKFAESLRGMGRTAEAAVQYEELAKNRRQPVYVQSIATLTLAQTLMLQGKYDEAVTACKTVCSSPMALPHHKFEAQSMIKVCENLKAGRAARDPEEFRNRLDPLPQPAVALFVSPDGSDRNSGTIKEPFATVTKARDAIRELKKTKEGIPVGGVAVYLRGGTYKMEEPLELTKEDSGKFGAPVVYTAWQDERPVFDGGKEIKKFKKVRDSAILSRLPEESHGKVYVADLKAQGFKDLEPQKGYGYGVNNEAIRMVYEDEKFMPISRWPNDSRIPIVELLEDNDRAFKVDCDRLARWTTAEDLMADGFWYYLWAGEALHVESVDPSKGIITLAKKPGRGLQKGRPFCVMNLLEEIDRPGEWFIDCKNGLLYIWLQKHPWFTDVVVSERKESFIKAEEVHDIVFKGITFQYGQDRAADFINCVNLTITGCRFHGFGGTAMRILNAANVKIYGNKLDTLGHGGMRVSGGNRKNLTSGGIQIENNEVGHFGLCSKTYVPAILLEGVGAKVRHNWFHHAPSSAMRIEGNDHLVEYNLTEFVVQESDDQGGIDMWGNLSYRGCVMRYNIWRDIGGGDIPCGQAGIRFDDAISGMVVYGNIFERSSNGHFGGVQIHGGQMNIIDNNVFIDCKYAVSFSPWSLDRFHTFINEKINSKLYKEVNIDLPPYSDRYPSLKALKDDSKQNINSIWRNIITGTDTPFYHAPKGTDFCDNHIVDSYSPDSPLIKNSTFSKIPVSEIGPYEDPNCAW